MFKKDRCFEETSKMNASATFDGNEMNMDMNYSAMASMPGANCCPMNPCMPTMCPPVYECPQERVCHRTINYEVPQV